MVENLALKTLGESEEGVAAIELAAICAVLATLAVGMFEFATAIHQNVQLQQAARAGVEYAMKFPSDVAGIEQAVIGSTRNPSSGLNISINQFCECPDATSIVCTDTCPVNVLPNTFVQVSLAQPASGILSPTGLLPGISLSASATMRVR
jgi:Flp pilus assembly protein TadG